MRARKILGLNVLAACALTVTAAIFGGRPACGQTGAPQAASGQSKAAALEMAATPFSIELYATKVRFANDGTGTRRLDVRIKVESLEGAQELHTLTFDYNSSYQKFALDHLRIMKPGGETTAKPEAITEAAAPTVKDAHAFAEFREVKITVPPLGPGDTLAYEVTLTTLESPARGQFWYAHQFLAPGHARDESLEVQIPTGRTIHTRTSPEFAMSVAHEAAVDVYTWKRNLSAAPASKEAEGDQSPEARKQANVIITSFADWDATAKWLSRKLAPTTSSAASLKEKVAQITSGQTGEAAKIEALYNFVAKKIQPVAISASEAGFSPHAEGAVLQQGYGDNLDKCVLLASMLDFAGIPARIALLSSKTKFDESLPWPGAISHLLVTIHENQKRIWLDPSSDVLPFRFLPPAFRGKQAIILAPAGLPRAGSMEMALVRAETPEGLPFPSTQIVDLNGSVSSLGKLVLHVRYMLRGDNEYPLRLAFRNAPKNQWDGIAQTMAALDGLHGTVSSASPSNPTKTRDPFTLDFTIQDPNFLDWSQKAIRLALPVPTFGLPDPPKNAAAPIVLGSALGAKINFTLNLPPNDSIEPPVAGNVSRDYASYSSHYDVREHALTAERSLRFFMHEVPASRRADYLAFREAVEKDESQPILISNTSPGVPAEASAADLMNAGAAELKSRNFAKALALFEKVRELDPKQKNLSLSLGIARLQMGKFAEAAEAFLQQLAENPSDSSANTLLGVALYDQKKYEEAAAAFQKQITLNPLDPNAYAYLGLVYSDEGKFAEAAHQLEKAAVISPDNAAIQLRLGRAYLSLHKNEQALAAFKKALAISSTPAVMNDIAFRLADANVELDTARKYANQALSASESKLATLDLRKLTANEAALVAELPAFWDTLGWIDFREGKIAEAESLIRPAWLLGESGRAANHLAQIYESRHQNQNAVRMYAFSLATRTAPEGTGERFQSMLATSAAHSQASSSPLGQDTTAIDTRVKRAAAELQHLRTVSLANPNQIAGTAQFLVLLESRAGATVAREARFLSGSDDVASEGQQFAAAKFPELLPAASKGRIFLRGTVACASKTAPCEFRFDLPQSLLQR